MRAVLVLLAAQAAREPFRYREPGIEPAEWDGRSLREQERHAAELERSMPFIPIEPLELPRTPLLESVPVGKASRDIVVGEMPEIEQPVDSLGEMPEIEQPATPHLQRSLSFAQSENHVDINMPDKNGNNGATAEDNDGAPFDGYHVCADAGEDCACSQGTVRFGQRGMEIDEWTMPVKLGEHGESVQCSVKALQKYRVHKEPQEGSYEPQGCECIRRSMQLTSDMGKGLHPRKTASLLESAQNETEWMSVQRSVGQKSKYCAVPGPMVEALMQTDEDTLVDELGSDTRASLLEAGERLQTVAVRECRETADEEWIYLRSTGQLQHKQTKLCITVEYQVVKGFTRVILKPCTLTESQRHVQRWDMPFYLMPEFKKGTGYIKVGYGSHSRTAQCLVVDGDDLAVIRCDNAMATQWTVDAWGDPHVWESCSGEDQQCNCAGGEVRFGDADMRQFSAGVPVKESVTCSLSELRKLALPDPTVSRGGNVECECRHDPFVDGDGDPISGGQKNLLEMLAFKNSHGAGSGALIAVICAVLGIGIAGGAFVYLRKRKDAAWHAEEEEEE